VGAQRGLRHVRQVELGLQDLLDRGLALRSGRGLDDVDGLGRGGGDQLGGRVVGKGRSFNDFDEFLPQVS
jgi:hypothetical protein